MFHALSRKFSRTGITSDPLSGKVTLSWIGRMLRKTHISSIFVDGRSGESIVVDAAYLDAVLVPLRFRSSIFQTLEAKVKTKTLGIQNLTFFPLPSVEYLSDPLQPPTA